MLCTRLLQRRFFSAASSIKSTVQASAYAAEFKKSVENPAAFWAEKAKNVQWMVPPPTASLLSQDANGIHRWFKGGKLNVSMLATEVQAKERPDQAAIICDSPVTKTKHTLSFKELDEQVGRMAYVLQNEFNIKKGDVVAVYMPMIAEAVIAMLAITRIGAIHTVIFGGFAPHELHTRFSDTQPRMVITASGSIEIEKVVSYPPMVDAALKLYNQPSLPVLCVHRTEMPQASITAPSAWPSNYRDWKTLMNKHQGKRAAAVACDATDPLYVLYTSGSTGKPKGIPRDHGSVVALKYAMDSVMKAKPGSVYWAGSDVGWVVGHSFCVYGPLVQGCTSVIYEGKPIKTPDAGAFWRVISEHKVNNVFAAPTAWRAIRKEDPELKLMRRPGIDISGLQNVFLAGERLDPPTLSWLQQSLPKCGVLDNWWQTETGWPVCANPIGLTSGLPVKPGSATLPMPGYNVQILDEAGQQAGPNQSGQVVIKLPLPPSCLWTVWNNHSRFESGYLATYPGYYLTGDGGYIDQDGYVFIMGRTDDVINVSAHRLSTGEMEEIVGSHPLVAECAVFAVDDALKGEVPVGFIVLKDTAEAHSTPHATIYNQLIKLVRDQIGAVASFRQVFVVKRLPKTRSGKILRATIRAMTKKTDVPVPSTIDDPAILDEIREVLKVNKVGPLYA